MQGQTLIVGSCNANRTRDGRLSTSCVCSFSLLPIHKTLHLFTNVLLAHLPFLRNDVIFIPGCNVAISLSPYRVAYFSSPPLSSQHPDAMTCNYTITVKSGHRVALSLITSDISNSTLCTAKNISVFEGADATGDQLYDGCRFQRIIARTNQLFLQFKSSGISNEKGFSAIIHKVQKPSK